MFNSFDEPTPRDFPNQILAMDAPLNSFSKDFLFTSTHRSNKLKEIKEKKKQTKKIINQD